ncbi:MAG: hypothetical protein M3178_14060 [Pseudomonadota bacterium]|nr:hypothetical protein [Pseudomonadota bacterium]
MFAAEQDFLHAPIAAELKVLLEQHIGLRAYYPATEDFYDSVRSGHLERPLPIDAVEDFIRGVRDNTPTAFEPNVADTLQGVAQPVPTISSIDEMPPPGNAQPVPPRDPLGEVDPLKEQRFILASGVNLLWKAIKSGPTAYAGYEGWSNIVETLSPHASAILRWLRGYLGM